MHIFEKLLEILELCPIVKFRSSPRKIGPQTFGGPPQPKNPACITHEISLMPRVGKEYQVPPAN